MRERAENSVMVLGDARRGYIWYACYDRGKNLPVRRNHISLIPADQLSLKSCDCEILTTSDWERISPILKKISHSCVVIEERLIPDACTVGELTFRKISMNLPSEPLIPIYLHPAVVQRQAVSMAK
jgi:tRNA A37 threonylcarbamoyladenosine modification protein TsaB